MFALIGLLTVSLTQSPQSDNPGKLVSDMLARYSTANAVAGKIAYRVNGTNVGVDTLFQFEKPNKLYIQQKRGGSQPRTLTVISDGVRLSYDPPENVAEQSRLYESVGKTATVRDLYRVVLSTLLDKNVGIDVAISRTEDLRYLRNQWATMQFSQSDSDETRVVTGQWRQSKDDPVSGQYQMVLTKDGELKKYSIKQSMMPDPNAGPVDITEVWDISIQIDGKLDPNLFKVK